VIEPIEDVPVAVGDCAGWDGSGLLPELAGLLLAAGEAGQVGSLE
jgi:hypothetical protein